MKKLLLLLLSLLFLTSCTHETQALWEDFTEGFNHDPEREPVKVVKGYSGEAQANFNKGTAKTAKISKFPASKTAVIGHQRINTTVCNDLDDWYLDGFRVGKSFRTQKTEMFQKRTQYCQGKLPNAHRTYWENGYQIGVKS